MKKLDEKFLISGPTRGFYLSAKAICQMQECSERYVRVMFDGIREQIKKGRYNRYAILDEGLIRCNIYVYYDYSKYHKSLDDKMMCKYVPPFNPMELAALCPVVEHTIVVDCEDDQRRAIL